MYSISLLMLTCMIGYSNTQAIIYDVNTQGVCTEVQRGPTRDCRWVGGLDMVDQIIEKGRIIAYQILWFTGKWSVWFVPGINDISDVYNLSAQPCAVPYRKNSMRRNWAVFYDHTHKFIICKPRA